MIQDAIREIMKYKGQLNALHNDGHHHHGQTMELVNEFRAQRNFYIIGMSLFLWL
jgi:hypothetical protein